MNTASDYRTVGLLLLAKFAQNISINLQQSEELKDLLGVDSDRTNELNAPMRQVRHHLFAVVQQLDQAILRGLLEVLALTLFEPTWIVLGQLLNHSNGLLCN